jgi:hypothetical protein
MITDDFLINWEVEEMAMPGLSQVARTKMLGLSSNIHKDKITRKKLWENQLVGYMGQMKVIEHLTGTNLLFYQDVEELGSKPVGDGGSDIPGGRLDVKTTLMRNSPNWGTYHLLVRPKEFHEDTVYVQCLVSSYSSSGAKGMIVGWLYSDEIRGRCMKDEKRFGDAYCVPVTNLHPFMNCRWERQ